MKQTFITILLVFSLNCFSQQLVLFKIDKDVTVNLPNNSTITDTIGQRIIHSTSEGVDILFCKTLEKEKKVTIQNEKDLKGFYKGFQDGYAKSAKGKITHSSISVRDQLTICQFDCNTTIDGINKEVECLVVFLNNYAYSVQFIKSGKETESFTAQKKAILSSLQFRKGLNINNQFNDFIEGTIAYKLGEVAGYFLGVAILVILIVVILKKSKERKPY